MTNSSAVTTRQERNSISGSGKFDEDTKLTTKLYRFAKGLEPGRQAEVWYLGLLAHQTATWDSFYTAFLTKWPLPTIIEPLREELLEKLDQTKLTTEEVGVTTERDGDQMYSHIAWAEEVRALVNALDDAKGHLIPQVRRGLPLNIRLTLPTGLNTWNTFLAAVTSLSMDRLADQRENTEVIWDNILQKMGLGGQQHTTNMATTRLTATSFYSPTRSKTPTPQAAHVAPTPATPNTVRPTYTPTRQWNTQTPSTPVNQRFNQPMNTPVLFFLPIRPFIPILSFPIQNYPHLRHHLQTECR
jgi:hypothetical protein